MGTSNHPKTFSDLYAALLNNARADSSTTSIVNEAKRMINSALHDMHITDGEHFSWVHRRASLVTQPDYSTGSVTITQGGTSVAGTSTVWNTANSFGANNARVGGKLSVAGSPNVYEVTAVTDDTTLTISPMFVDESVSAENYTYYEDEYSLASDFLRPLDFQFFDADREIEIIGEGKFRRNFPRNNTTGKPIVCAIFDAPFDGDTAPVRKILFHKPPNEAFIIPYSYVTSNLAVASDGTEQAELSADDDEPMIPLRYRNAIVFKGLSQWYLERRNDVTRAAANEQKYRAMLADLKSDIEVGGDKPRFAPRISGYYQRARRPFGGRGRYTLGTAFDELRDR